jgi:hypothetical protein
MSRRHSRASFRAFFSEGHKRSSVSMTQQGEHNAIANRWFGENDLTLSKLEFAGEIARSRSHVPVQFRSRGTVRPTSLQLRVFRLGFLRDRNIDGTCRGNLQTIRSFLPPALDPAGPIPHPVLQCMFDPLVPPGLQYYRKAHFVDEISDKAIDIHSKHGSAVPNIFSPMHLYPINGAAHRVGKTDTASSYCDSNWGR